MAKIECKAVWADPDQWVDCLVEYVGIVDYATKKGSIVHPMLFLGPCGEIYCFKERIANLRSLILELGSDDQNWMGKKFIMKSVKDFKKFTLTYHKDL